jgi:hypothetical protein
MFSSRCSLRGKALHPFVNALYHLVQSIPPNAENHVNPVHCP